MNAENLRDWLTREPFQPFRIHTTSGASYDIHDPQSMALNRKEAFIAPADERWEIVPYIHMSAIETVRNGKSRGRRRKR